jgi:N-acetylmuramoyl-L-alanine amidase CwlA
MLIGDFNANLNLKVELIGRDRHNRPGTVIPVKYITIHNTDNEDPGADAVAHSKFVRNTGYYVFHGQKEWVSWHFSVDDHVAIKQLPVNEEAYHAFPAANGSSVAIEICMNQGIDHAAANRRAALLTAALIRDLRLPADCIRTHNSWTQKNCPQLLLDNERPGPKWQAFLAQVAQATSDLPTGTDLLVASQDELPTLMQRVLGPIRRLLRRSPPGTGADVDHKLIAEQLRKEY